MSDEPKKIEDQICPTCGRQSHPGFTCFHIDAEKPPSVINIVVTETIGMGEKIK